MSNSPNDIPNSDWQANFYDVRGNADTTSFTTVTDARQGCLPAYREEPLQDPYILWDSRAWVKDSDVLENQGTAGAAFDLAVEWSGGTRSTHPNQGRVFPYDILYGYKTLNWDNSYTTTTSPPGGFPDDVSEIGGDTCSGAFTIMIAFSELFVREVTGVDRNNYRYAEVDFLSNHDVADGGGIALDQNILGDNSASSPTTPDYDVFHEWYDGAGNYCQWLAESPGPGHEVPTGWDLAGKLVTITADPWLGRYWVWVDDELVHYYDVWGDFEPLGYSAYQMNFVDWPGLCSTNNDGPNPTKFKELFLYFYGHEGPRHYEAGAAWQSVIGTAFFRGQPSPADRAYWKEYFVPSAGQPYQTSGARHFYERLVSNTSAHTFDFIVPTNPLNPEAGSYPCDEIVINIFPASGGSGLRDSFGAYAIVQVSGGDIITVELGGGGGGSGGGGGLGGWPDGGNGGVSSSTGVIGGGGGGSTRIYRNGTLVIHAPGGGGGATLGASITIVGSRVSRPESERQEGYYLAGDVIPNEAAYGQGGTTVAAGAGGTGGGGNASGSTGGVGTTTSGAVGSSGGGGGGGGKFGGGGGGSIVGGGSPNTYGGGSGSWWWNTGIVQMLDLGTGGIITTAIGQPANVTIHYW